MNITLEYTVTGIEEQTPPQAYGLEVSVKSAADMTTKIFVFQRNAASNTDPQANEEDDQFISLADPVDIAQYPEDEPDLEYDMPYYRKDSVSLLFRSAEELEETKSLIKADVADLVRTLNLLEGTGVTEEESYGV